MSGGGQLTSGDTDAMIHSHFLPREHAVRAFFGALTVREGFSFLSRWVNSKGMSTPAPSRPVDPRLLAMAAASLILLLGLGWILAHLDSLEKADPVVTVDPPPEAPVPPPTDRMSEPPPEPPPASAPEPEPTPVPAAVVVKPLPSVPSSESEPDERLALFEQELHLVAPMANRQENLDLYRDAIHLAIETGRWDLYRPFLKRAFEASMQGVSLRTGNDRFQTLLAEPLFVRAMGMHGFLRAVDDAYLSKLADESPDHAFHQWLLHGHPTALGEFIGVLTGAEDSGNTLALWSNLWSSETDEAHRETYRALALACALVYGGRGSTPDWDAAMHRYTLFRDHAEAGRLTGKIHRMPATDLVWVVDVDVPDPEIEWALRKMHLPRRRWGQAYGMVEYLMERAVEGANPYEEYTFEEILKHGGICGDQSYFAANTAKCHGIPAAIMSGDGDRGPHAWIVWKPEDDTWAEAGNTGYTTGATAHPQTGERIHQSLLMLEGDRRNGGARLADTRAYLRFMDLFLAYGEEAIAEEALDLALRSTPEHPLPWRRLVHFREKRETSLEQWEDLADTLRRRFRDRPDFLAMADAIEDEHIFPHRDAERNVQDLRRERRRLARDHEGRSDLLLASIRRQADILSEEGDFDGITSLYRKAFRDFGEQAEAFATIADQYFACAGDDPGRRDKACREIELAYQRHIDTESGEYFRASQEVRLLRRVAGFYRTVGDTKKANSLERRARIREERAKRGAL